MTNKREELLKRMEESNGSRKPLVSINQRSTRRRTVSSSDKYTIDQSLQFEIYDAEHPLVISGKRKPDDILVCRLKAEINSMNITRRDLYSFIGNVEGALFENENQAYNLEYGLRMRATISMECAERWLTIIGKRMQIEFVAIER